MRSFVLSFLSAAMLVLGLQSQTANTDIQIQEVDCSRIYSLGCNSLNEMIAARDKQLLEAIGSRTAIACFRTSEDRFFIFAFSVPYFGVSTGEVEGLEQTPGTALFASFEKGTSHEYRRSFGSWTKLKAQRAEDAWFESSPKSALQAFINPSEISLQYKFPNIGSTTTTYTGKIRRSTLRFSETYEWPEQGNSRSKTGPARSPRPMLQNQYSGNCAKLS